MKGQYIIAYDLGTGGNKASLYDFEGRCLAENFVSYPTRYPATGWHEQRPQDWWRAVVESTNRLLEETSIDRNEIACCGISGHSLGVVPLDHNGNLLREAEESPRRRPPPDRNTCGGTHRLRCWQPLLRHGPQSDVCGPSESTDQSAFLGQGSFAVLLRHSSSTSWSATANRSP